ncbi:MAG: TerB family tellurite resistance protein [Planctomycetaceae bacterium]
MKTLFLSSDDMNQTLHLRNLLVMALADGSLCEREVNFVTDRCAELGLGEDELREAVRFALDENAAVALPRERSEQETLMADLLRMMAADGQLTETEKRLFALAAAKLDFDPQQIDQLIERLSKNR